MSNRIQRVNSLIKSELSQILLREIDLSGVLVTITRVETSVDLNDAKVYISVMPARQNFAKQNLGGPAVQTDKIFKILDGGIYNIQQKLNERLKMRPIPKIRFEKEEKTKEAARVEELLEEIKDQNNS